MVAAAAGSTSAPDFTYSNSNYVLLADIIRKVTGTPFPAYITKTIFKPLGLDMILDPGPDVPNKATSYFVKDGKYVDATSGWLQLGDGEIQTTPSQLVKWADNYRTGKFGGRKLLQLQLKDAVPVGKKLGPRAKAYGAGIWEEKDGRLAHTGGWEGFATTFLISRDRHYALGMTCNYLPSDPKDIATLGKVVNTIMDSWAGPDN